jgi:uncharacterized protein YecA (UPF0149 family)
MNTKKVYIVDDGTVTKERLLEMFSKLKDASEITPEVISMEEAERRHKLLSTPPTFPDPPKVFKITNPYRHMNTEAPAPVPQYIRPDVKIHNNDPCHCGSGKKYKKCCLKH